MVSLFDSIQIELLPIVNMKLNTTVRKHVHENIEYVNLTHCMQILLIDLK